MTQFNQSGGDRTRPPGDPRIREEIQRRTPLVGGKTLLTNLPGGKVITPVSGPEYKRFVLPFHPRAFYSAGANINAVLQPGLVIVRHIEQGLADGLKSFEPNIANVSLWVSPPPDLQLAGNVSYNYLHCNTNELGAPNKPWEVISSASERASTHHVPPDPEGTNGANGEYYIELFRTNFGTSATNAVDLKWGGHYIWDQALWAGIHPGFAAAPDTAARPYKKYDENANRHHFRYHLRGHGHNVAEQTNSIQHTFFGRNIGGGGSNVGNVYTGNTTKTAAEFNVIKERASQPQISITQTNNESPIVVSGNGNDLTLSFKDCNGATVYTLSFIDGLVQQSGAADIQLGNCTNNASPPA